MIELREKGGGSQNIEQRDRQRNKIQKEIRFKKEGGNLMRSRIPFIVAGLILMLVFLVVACAKKTPTPTATPTAPPPHPPIKIGQLVPFTGDLSFIGRPFAFAAKMAAEDVNAAGGVLGRKIEILAEDTATETKTAIDALHKLIEIEKVQAIVGPPTSFNSMAAIDIIKMNKVLMISGSATSPDLTAVDDDDFYFRTAPSDALQGAAIAILAWNKGYRTANVIARDDAYGRGLARVFTNTFEKLGGKVLVTVIYDPKAPDYSGYVAKVSSKPADLIQVNALMEDGTRLFRKFRDAGLMKKYKFLVCEGVQDPKIPQEVGIDVMVGIGGATPYPRGSETWVKTFTQRFGEAPAAYEANVYDNVILIALATQKAGKYEGTAIRDNLRDVANPPGQAVTDVAEALSLVKEGKDINYQGVGGEITFDEHGDVSVRKARVWEYDEEGNYKFTGEIEVK